MGYSSSSKYDLGLNKAGQLAYWRQIEGAWQQVPSPEREEKCEFYTRFDVGDSEPVWRKHVQDGCDNPGRTTVRLTSLELPAELKLALTLLEIPL